MCACARVCVYVDGSRQWFKLYWDFCFVWFILYNFSGFTWQIVMFLVWKESLLTLKSFQCFVLKKKGSPFLPWKYWLWRIDIMYYVLFYIFILVFSVQKNIDILVFLTIVLPTYTNCHYYVFVHIGFRKRRPWRLMIECYIHWCTQVENEHIFRQLNLMKVLHSSDHCEAFTWVYELHGVLRRDRNNAHTSWTHLSPARESRPHLSQPGPHSRGGTDSTERQQDTR